MALTSIDVPPDFVARDAYLATAHRLADAAALVTRKYFR